MGQPMHPKLRRVLLSGLGGVGAACVGYGVAKLWPVWLPLFELGWEMTGEPAWRSTGGIA